MRSEPDCEADCFIAEGDQGPDPGAICKGYCKTRPGAGPFGPVSFYCDGSSSCVDI